MKKNVELWYAIWNEKVIATADTLGELADKMDSLPNKFSLAKFIVAKKVMTYRKSS